MLKKILAFMVMLYAAVCFAAVDANKATAAELDGVKGIGPTISARIVEERAKGQYKDWNDFITRVKGVGETNAVKLSEAGLTVGGATYKGAAAAPAAAPAAAAKKEDKPAAKTEVKKTEEKPAPAAKQPASDPKADAKAKKDAEKQAKADEKAKKAAEKQAKADEKAKKSAPAAAPASAASAPKK